MTRPPKGSPKPHDDDSWESLSEDLFGIDFHQDDSDDDLDDDDDFPARGPESPANGESSSESSVSSIAGDDNEEDLSFDFGDEMEAKDEPSRQTSSPNKPTAPETPVSATRQSAPRRRVEEKRSQQDDSFWDTLNDWDDSSQESASNQEEEAATDDQEETTSSEKHKDESRSPRGRRRRRRGGRDQEATADREPRTPKRGSRQEPEPIARSYENGAVEGETDEDEDFLEEPEEFAFEAGDDDDSSDFGAGLEGDPQRSRGRGRSSQQGDKPARRPSPLEDVTPSSRSSASGEKPAGRRRRQESSEADRPSRRRQGRVAEKPVHDEPVDESDLDFSDWSDEEPSPAPKRRESSRNRTRAPEPSANDPFGDVPTWSQAIGLLVHRPPKKTSDWSPETDDYDSRPPRRGSRRPSSGPGNRRRRRSN